LFCLLTLIFIGSSRIECTRALTRFKQVKPVRPKSAKNPKYPSSEYGVRDSWTTLFGTVMSLPLQLTATIPALKREIILSTPGIPSRCVDSQRCPKHALRRVPQRNQKLSGYPTVWSMVFYDWANKRPHEFVRASVGSRKKEK
jgi:hypothetical protein